MTGSGEYGELLARAFLVREGFRIIETNYRFHHGEIDIVAEEGEVLVFCEVKTRTNDTIWSTRGRADAVEAASDQEDRPGLSYRPQDPRPDLQVRCGGDHPASRGAGDPAPPGCFQVGNVGPPESGSHCDRIPALEPLVHFKCDDESEDHQDHSDDSKRDISRGNVLPEELIEQRSLPL